MEITFKKAGIFVALLALLCLFMTACSDSEVHIHKWGEWAVQTEPTCTEEGTETRTCTNDAGHMESRSIAATGHDDGEWEVTLEATCETDGKRELRCKTDNALLNTETIAALGHKVAEWTETIPPVLAMDGEESGICDHCKLEITRTISTPGNTVNDPYLINTDSDLVEFRDAVNSGYDFAGKYFALSADIDLQNIGWIPIGTNSYKFKGTFDGKGYTVGNYTLLAAEEIGLFGCNGGTIKNLGVVRFTFNITDVDTAIYAGGLVGYNRGNLLNCYSATESGIRVTVSGITKLNTYVGGLVGFDDGNIVIENCYSITDVRANVRSGIVCVGGLIGYGNYRTTIIKNCYATGEVIAVNSTSAYMAYAGGLVGKISGTDSSAYVTNVLNCYATGNVTAEYTYALNSLANSYAGGLIAVAMDINIKNCYATGNIRAGMSTSGGSAYAGGLVGAAPFVTLENSYAFSEQKFLITEGSTQVTAASNSLGDKVLLSELNDENFYSSVLGWSNEIWNFESPDYSNKHFPSLRPVVL